MRIRITKKKSKSYQIKRTRQASLIQQRKRVFPSTVPLQVNRIAFLCFLVLHQSEVETPKQLSNLIM